MNKKLNQSKVEALVTIAVATANDKNDNFHYFE